MIKHLACIMDGNRRWARRRGILPWYGHREGADVIRTVIEACLDHQIEHLSLYAFSLENFKRPVHENRYLFKLLVDEAPAVLEECLQRSVRIRFIGERSLSPSEVLPMCQRLEKETAECSTMQINFLFCYGAQQEVISAIKRIAADIDNGELCPNDLSQELFEQHLWTAEMPPPDLIIRTGGVRRLSNFFLYQAAYSELYFLDCLWPELTRKHLDDAIAYFHSCKRNFGT